MTVLDRQNFGKKGYEGTKKEASRETGLSVVAGTGLEPVTFGL